MDLGGNGRQLPDFHRRGAARGPGQINYPPNQQWDGPLDTALLTNLQFGKWREVLAEPRADAKWKIDTAMWLYAQGFAAANMHDLGRANKDRNELAGMVSRNEFAGGYDRRGSHVQMAEIGLSLLDGEIARLNGHLDEAIADFRKARDIEQKLHYGEPPTWHQPVVIFSARHSSRPANRPTPKPSTTTA